jgi:hypothetical protein
MTPDDHHDDAPVEELVRGLPRESAPPDRLEERVVNALRLRSLLAARTRWWMAAAAAAAIVLAFAAGWTSGAGWFAGASSGTRYVLLLYAGETSRPRGDAAVVEEYREWARTLRRSGRAVSGERLDAAPEVQLGGTVPFDGLAGYFIIEAANDDDALRVAKAHPHLRHGGRIVVRRIAST